MPSSNRNTVTIDVQVGNPVSYDLTTKGANGSGSGSVSLQNGAHIESLSIEQRIDAPDYARITFSLYPEGKEPDYWLMDAFAPGDTIEVKLGLDTEEPTFKGEISYIEPQLSSDKSDATITIAGYDLFHRLTRGTNSRTWGDGHKEEKTLTDVAKDVINKSMARKGDGDNKLSAGTTEDVTAKIEYLPQVAVNDYSFLRHHLSAATGLIPDEDSAGNAGKVSFQVAKLFSAEPKLKINRNRMEPVGESGRIFSTADLRLSTVKQVHCVEVRGYNVADKKGFVGKAESVANKVGAGDSGPDVAGKAHYGAAATGNTLTLVDMAVSSEAEAKQIAQAVIDQLSMDHVTGTVVIEGVPDLKAGDIIELTDMGDRFSGKYLCEQVTHLFTAGGRKTYTCRIRVARNTSKII